MKVFTKSFYLVAILFIFGSCNEHNTRVSDNKVSTDKPDELKVGGLYLLKNKDSTYCLSKILAIDDFAVHLRTYRDTFKTKPKDINSENLRILIGHAPLDKNGFLTDKPELLKVEAVKDQELEGYKMNLEEMSK